MSKEKLGLGWKKNIKCSCMNYFLYSICRRRAGSDDEGDETEGAAAVHSCIAYRVAF